MLDFNSGFEYSPSPYVPFRDKAVLQKVRNIKREDFLNHSNKSLTITIMTDTELVLSWISDLFFRIKEAMDADRQLVMSLPQPWPLYEHVAHMINRAKINCRKLYTFNMDEYANEDGVIAPETWPYGFTYSLKTCLYNELDSALRPPEK